MPSRVTLYVLAHLLRHILLKQNAYQGRHACCNTFSLSTSAQYVMRIRLILFYDYYSTFSTCFILSNGAEVDNLI
jgi:hypothetical protein